MPHACSQKAQRTAGSLPALRQGRRHRARPAPRTLEPRNGWVTLRLDNTLLMALGKQGPVRLTAGDLRMRSLEQHDQFWKVGWPSQRSGSAARLGAAGHWQGWVGTPGLVHLILQLCSAARQGRGWRMLLAAGLSGPASVPLKRYGSAGGRHVQLQRVAAL